jgi:hypothetical protein
MTENIKPKMKPGFITDFSTSSICHPHPHAEGDGKPQDYSTSSIYGGGSCESKRNHDEKHNDGNSHDDCEIDKMRSEIYRLKRINKLLVELRDVADRISLIAKERETLDARKAGLEREMAEMEAK